MIKAYLRGLLGDPGVKLLKKATGRYTFDESRLVHAAICGQSDTGVMIDVGAHFGIELAMFVSSGWQILAFEPDVQNRKQLEISFGKNPKVVIDNRAVTDAGGKELAFFTSEVSTGISGLSAFHESHAQTQTVQTTTVAAVVEQHKLEKIDFLKIDVEGFDFSVIKGIDWEGVTPDVILCEFEDAKTLPLGHSAKDVFDYLVARGYQVTISEWHPILEYGQSHKWKSFVDHPDQLAANGWGNMIAYRDEPRFAALSIDNIEQLAKNVYPKQFKTV